MNNQNDSIQNSDQDVVQQEKQVQQTVDVQPIGFFDNDIVPPDPTGWEIIVKGIIGTVVGCLIAALIALVIFILGTDTFLSNARSLLPFILILTAFVCTLIGNVMVMGAYNLFLPKVYYDFTRMFSMVLLSTGSLFFVFALVYVIANSGEQTVVFLVLGFHVAFSAFIAYTMMEFSSNPSYAGSAFMGSTGGFVIAMIFYLLVFNANRFATSGTQVYIMMLFPAIFSYSLLPVVMAIRQKIYYQFYEMGNNFFYIPTVHEDRQQETIIKTQEKEHVDINVDS